ncbi:hypothetical protein ACIQVE_03370 [Pseudomonas sp. NPDC098747]|uniref:hypothetical protein n=1 Tax=Pseudomonas sp. NPDC098747 TaxID=3364487 RepID=UPI00383A8877
MKKLLLLLIAAMTATSASAEIIDPTPSNVCSLLSDSGLKGRKWVDDYGDGSSGCASDYKDIGSASGLANNLSFYVTGVSQYVMEIKLVFNYNQPSQSSSATKALLAASDKLSQRALGASLPAPVIALIKRGEHGSAKVGKGVVEVVREDWPTGKGYEVHVMMR